MFYEAILFMFHVTFIVGMWYVVWCWKLKHITFVQKLFNLKQEVEENVTPEIKVKKE